MRLTPALVAVALVLAAAGCGGDDKAKGTNFGAIGPIGKGAAGVWIYTPKGKPKDLVVYFHGQGGPQEATPVNHLAWINHLVRRGSLVIYPRYEMAYEVDPMKYVVQAMLTARNRVDVKSLPVLSLGYSRGGAIAVEYAAVADRFSLPVPDEVLSVFPAPEGNQQNKIDLTTIPHSTKLRIMVGKQDQIVDGTGARYLLRRLEAGGYPGENISLAFVGSHGSFVADHFAPLQTTPAAQAAFWSPTDRLLDALD